MQSLYVLVDIAIIAAPLALSFDRKVAFYRHWPSVGLSLLVVSSIYIAWDIAVTHVGHWGFNPEYTGTLRIAGLPLGEVLFFVAVPYACLFIYAVARAYFRERRASNVTVVRIVGLAVAVLVLVAALLVRDRGYTALALLSVAVMGVVTVVVDPGMWLSSYTYLYLLISFVPFMIANGLLTAIPVVTYNPEAILGVRIFTIPVEDTLYNLAMLSLYLFVYRRGELLRGRVRGRRQQPDSHGAGRRRHAAGGTRRIAIIGAGLGGLSAGARLAAAGHEVDIYDSQGFPGGKAGSVAEGGYRFDTGPSLVTMPEVFDQLFAACGERREEFIRFRRLEEICRYFFADGTRLVSSTDRARFGAEVERHTDDSAQALFAFLDYSRRIHRSAASLFLEHSLHESRTYLSGRGIASIFGVGRIDPFRTMDRAVRSFFHDPRMIQFFDRYATYNGSDPFRTPATLNIIPHVEYEVGAVSADDGICTIPTAIASLAEKAGARIHLSTPVTRIVADESTRRVSGVVAGGRTRSCDLVVSNIDVVRTYRDLLIDSEAPMLRRYLKMEPSSSGLVFLLGMTERYPELGLHNIFFSEDYRSEFRDIFTHRRCPIDPTVYVNISSKVNDHDAPAGGENWFVLVNAPHNAGQDWQSEVSRTREAVLSTISRRLGRDIEPAIAIERVMTPVDLESATGSRHGSLYGVSSNTRMAAFLRHPNRARRYPGLYFCGGGVHPGGGMPMVVLSGKIASELILRDIERGRV